MKRYSLYIDHQLVSGLIRQLENIVKTCHEELDEEYETYELRTSIYEEFVFQITTIFNANQFVKQEETEIKDESLKKIYELTSKLQEINSSTKYEEMNWCKKKGRPTKNLKAQERLFEWINQKVKSQGKIKFLKKQLDDIYVPLMKENQKKVIPVNNYLKILKKYNLNEITLVVRGGKQRTVKDYEQSKAFVNSFYKKEEEDYELKYDNASGCLESTSEFQSELSENYNSKEARLITRTSHLDQSGINFQKRNLRSSRQNQSKRQLKLRKEQSKQIIFNNFLDEKSDQQCDFSNWDKNFSVSEELFNEIAPNAQIYENSKSFQ